MNRSANVVVATHTWLFLPLRGLVLNAYNSSSSNFNNILYDILKPHEKLYKATCLVQNVKNGPIFTHSYMSPWFFLNWQKYPN